MATVMGTKPLPPSELVVTKVFGDLLFISTANRKHQVVGGAISGCDEAIHDKLSVELFVNPTCKL